MKKAILFLISLILAGAIFVAAQASSSPIVQISLLNQDPNPARAGDTVSLRFKVENLGGQAVQNVDIELLQDYPFTVVSGAALKNLDNLDAYTTGNNYVNLEYTVKIDKDAVQGQKDLRVRYRLNNGAWITVSFPTSISSKDFAQIIYVDKAKLDPGKETDMKFTINNVGTAPLQNLVFSWNEPNGAILPIYSGDSKYIKYLDVGQSVDLTYKVIADINANPGLYQLNLNLKYESLTNTTSSIITTKAGVFVGGVTDFDVAFSESSAGTTSLSVANTGNNPAQSVSVQIPQQQGFMVTGSNSAIIGNLDKGDYTLVSFPIVSTSTFNATSQRRQGQTGQQANQQNSQRPAFNASANPNNLRVVIQYTDTTGQRQTLEKSVPIQFRSGTTTSATNGFTSRRQSSFIGSTWFWVILIAVAAAGFFVFRNKTRREKILGVFHKKR